MYRELVLELTKGNEWVKVQPPCSETVISEAEKSCRILVPRRIKKSTKGNEW